MSDHPPMDHPGTDALREHAAEADPAVTRHLETCARCRELADLARREEAALRGAIPVEPPRGLVESTLRAIEKEASPAPRSARVRGAERPARPGAATWVWVVVACAVAILAFVLVRDAPAPGPAPGTAPGQGPGPATGERPLPGAGAPPPAPGAPPAPAAPPAPPPPPAPETVPGPDPDAVPGPVPVTPPLPENPPAPDGTETITTKPVVPPPGTDSTTPDLYVVRSGKLGTAGGALVATTACELEVAETAAFTVPSSTRFTLARDGATLVCKLEQGGLAARTLGAKPYRVSTADGTAVPTGTQFVVWLESSRTHVATVEGSVRVGDSTVRPGFEVEVAKGKPSPLPRPIGKLPAWAAKLRPPRIELVRAFAFEGDKEGWTAGELVATGAHGSRGALRGVPRSGEWGMAAELEEAKGVLRTDPDLWIEATVKVDRATKVALQLWDMDQKENLAHLETVEAGAWTTIVARLGDFGDPSGKPRGRALAKGDRGTCFTVFAGEGGAKVELLVDDVRFYFAR